MYIYIYILYNIYILISLIIININDLNSLTAKPFVYIWHSGHHPYGPQSGHWRCVYFIGYRGHHVPPTGRHLVNTYNQLDRHFLLIDHYFYR